MAKANVARQQGDSFQARLFWLKATALLDPNSSVIRVVYETGPKGFDDILVEYDPQSGPLDHEGYPISRIHNQCKWHTTAGTFGYQDLIDPVFINAQRDSLLKRAYQAQQRYAPSGTGCRFEFRTNWRIEANNPLLDLIRKGANTIDCDRLFDGSTDRSRMGLVRRLWREHLEVGNAELNLFLRTLIISEIPDSLVDLRDRLDDKFAAVGLKRVPASESAFFYDDLITKLHAQGRINFDRETFADMVRSEGILEDSPQSNGALSIGVRSFMHSIDNLEDRCERMLDLVPYFDGRYIRDEDKWPSQVFPVLQAFSLEAAQSTDYLRIILDAHVSLAFCLGVLLNVKSGKRIEIEQRTGGRRFWSLDDGEVDSCWPKLNFENETIDKGCDEVALAIGLTHDVSSAVSIFVKRELKQVGQILHCRPEGGPSQQSIRCGRHAWMLAEAVAQNLQTHRHIGKHVLRAHLFIAGPNGFAFFLGQHQQAIGPAAIYEWDFDGQRSGGYCLGLSVGGPRHRHFSSLD